MECLKATAQSRAVAMIFVDPVGTTQPRAVSLLLFNISLCLIRDAPPPSSLSCPCVTKLIPLIVLPLIALTSLLPAASAASADFTSGFSQIFL